MDLIFGLVIVLATARGWSRGLLATVATYAAPVLGFMIAADWSDPVRDRLAKSIEAPDIALDFLAPVVVFVVVVAVVRLFAAIFARLLGVGRSLPGRVLGAAVSGAVVAVLVGAGVLMVDELLGDRSAQDTSAQVSGRDPDPLKDFVFDVDRQIDESLLAPQLATLATAAWQKVSGKEGPLVVSHEIEQARDKAAQEARRSAAEAIQKSAMETAQREAAEAAKQVAGEASGASGATGAVRAPGPAGTPGSTGVAGGTGAAATSGATGAPRKTEEPVIHGLDSSR